MKSKSTIKIGIFGNSGKAEVKDLLSEIINILSVRKINFLIDKELSIYLSAKNKKHSATAGQILDESDYILSLGGDGTFLNTARKVGNRDIPILGINLGRLGFFSEVSPDEIKSFIPELMKNKFKIKEQTIIKAIAGGRKLFCLNDIVIDKSDSIRMIETETFYNEENVVKCISDGMIVSTPAGSTGYSMSCNGPIVNPKSSVFIITPISPHTLNVRPIIVPDNGTIKITLPLKGKARITADGQKSFTVNSPSEVVMSKAGYTIKVIKKLDSTYFNTLTKKLFWNVDKRNIKIRR